jgi:hypothetical protein
MKTLSSECGGMRKDTVALREDFRSEKHLREKAEATLKKLSTQAGKMILMQANVVFSSIEPLSLIFHQRFSVVFVAFSIEKDTARLKNV